MTRPNEYSRSTLPTIYAKRVLIEFLQMWFSQNAAFGMETFGRADVEPVPVDADGSVKARDGSQSLTIRDGWGRGDEADKKKKIVVQRGPMRWASRHYNEFLERIDIVVDGIDGATSLQDAMKFTDHMAIPVTAFCCSTEGLEAEEMANWVFFAVKFCRQQLREQFHGLRDIVSAEVGSEQLVERPSAARHELVTVPVTVILDIQFEWIVYESGTSPLRTIELRVTDEAEDVELSVEGD